MGVYSPPPFDTLPTPVAHCPALGFWRGHSPGVWSVSGRRQNYPKAESRVEESGGLCALRGEVVGPPRPRQEVERAGGNVSARKAAVHQQAGGPGRWCFATPELEKGSSHVSHLLQLLLLHLAPASRGGVSGSQTWVAERPYFSRGQPGENQSLTPLWASAGKCQGREAASVTPGSFWEF